jgi:hypothetical protein
VPKRKDKDPFENIWEGLGELMRMVDDATDGEANRGMDEVLDHLTGDRRDSRLSSSDEYDSRKRRDREAYRRGYRKGGDAD